MVVLLFNGWILISSQDLTFRVFVMGKLLLGWGVFIGFLGTFFTKMTKIHENKKLGKDANLR